MNPEKDYLAINKSTWNAKAAIHIDADFYKMDAFLAGATSLNEIELKFLKDIKGKSVLHLQCHFGQDSISLARMGAHVTAVDFSDKAIALAQELNLKTGSDVQFICSDVYSLPEHLNQQFDYIFTSYGTIGWLPDLKKWANVIQHFLKPGGSFVFAEFHPLVWMFDNDFKEIVYHYFKSEAIITSESGTYADKDANITTHEVSWNHGLAEVLNSLLGAGLQLKTVEEYDYSPYPCFNHVEEYENGKYRIQHLENKIPMVYALVTEKVKHTE